MFLLYHSEGCNMSETMFHLYYINDLYSTPCSGIRGSPHHISNYIKFQVPTAGTNYTKWRQIIISLLTMYKAMDQITDGAALAAPDDTWQAVDIQMYVVLRNPE